MAATNNSSLKQQLSAIARRAACVAVLLAALLALVASGSPIASPNSEKGDDEFDARFVAPMAFMADSAPIITRSGADQISAQIWGKRAVLNPLLSAALAQEMLSVEPLVGRQYPTRYWQKMY